MGESSFLAVVELKRVWGLLALLGYLCLTTTAKKSVSVRLLCRCSCLCGLGIKCERFLCLLKVDPTPTIGDPVPCLAETYCADDGRSPALSSRDIRQGPACTGGIRDPQPEGPQCGDPPGGRAPPLRAHPTLPTGTSARQGYPLKDLCLLNNSNHCYANSVVVMLMHLRCTIYARTTLELDSFLGRLLRTSRKALWSDIAWSTLARGWVRPSSQHDVAEL